MTLKTALPVYQAVGAQDRRYIKDAERPAELARLQQIIAASCSANPQVRATQEGDAQRLHVAMSPQCAVARDELAMMEAPSSRTPADVTAGRRRLVTAQCPAVATTGRWLVQWNGRGDLTPH